MGTVEDSEVLVLEEVSLRSVVTLDQGMTECRHVLAYLANLRNHRLMCHKFFFFLVDFVHYCLQSGWIEAVDEISQFFINLFIHGGFPKAE